MYLLKKIDLLLNLRLEGLKLVERALVLLDELLNTSQGVNGHADNCESEQGNDELGHCMIIYQLNNYLIASGCTLLALESQQ
jgi:hypothetical protein